MTAADFAARLQTHVDLGGAITTMAVRSCAVAADVVVATPDALVEALHDVMCNVSHHDAPELRVAAGLPPRCGNWPTYTNIARAAWPRLRASRG